MAAVVEAVSNVVESVGDAVGAVADTVSSVVGEAGKFVEQTGQAVGKTVEAIAKDPVKALPMIAVAVLAPELAPLLEISTPVAGMVLNTGIQLAEGRDPAQIAMNLGTSAITAGITDGLDLSTGNSVVDRAIGQTASKVIQGQDVGTALGSTIGGTLVGMGTRGLAGEIRDVTGLADERAPAPIIDKSEQYAGGAPSTDITQSQIFQDAIEKGFSPDEAYAIAQGAQDAAGPAYAPTARVSAQFLPGTVGIVSDTGETAAPLVTVQPAEVREPQKEEVSAVDLGSMLDVPTEPEGALPTAEAPIEQTPTEPEGGLPPAEAPTEPTPTEVAPTPTETESGLPTAEEPTAPAGPQYPFSGVIGSEQAENGFTTYTFDDGSTLTVTPDQEVVDFTEATEEPYEEPAAEEPEQKGGISIGFSRIGKGGTQARSMRRTAPKAPSGGLPSGIMDTPGAMAGSGLTPSLTALAPEYSLLGQVEQEPQQMAAGGSTDTSGIYDLSYTAASPFAQGKDIMILKPGLTKANINYALPGYPFGQQWKLAAEGGSIKNEHKPEFYSEGGLNSIKNRYVKGAGDGTSDSIPAMLANGEFVIPADVVSSLGNGDNDSGAKVLDEFLKTIREHKRRADPKKLPPDSKGALGYLLEAKKRVKK